MSQSQALHHQDPLGIQDLQFECYIYCWKGHCHAGDLLGSTFGNNTYKRWDKAILDKENLNCVEEECPQLSS